MREKIREVRQQYPQLAGTPEQAIVAQGTLQVVVAEDFGAGPSQRTDELLTATGERLQLHFAGSSPRLLTGQRAQLKAVRLGQHLVLSPEQLTVQADQEPLAAFDSLAAPTTRKLAVVLYAYQGYALPWTVDFARRTAFTDAFSLRNYFQEVSNGQLQFEGVLNPTDGDVFGWYLLPGPPPACADSGSNDAAAMAAADGFVEANYQHVVYAFVGPYCSLGRAEQGGRRVWINNAAFNLGVVAHELGHTLGLWHAPSARCTSGGVPVAFSNTCTQSEYGDSFDLMGNAWAHRHFKPENKNQRGWLPPANITRVTADGTYLLAPHALPSSGMQSMQVAEVDGPTFDLEFRQPTGVFDDFASTDPAVNGVLIRSASGLLDMTPSTTSSDDQALGVGRTFTDPGTGLRITTQAVNASGASVKVTFAPCVRKTPGMQLSPSFQTTSSGGQALPYSITVFNNDYTKCGASTFTLTPSLPGPGWSQSPLMVSGSIAPGASQTFEVFLTAPAAAPEALYDIELTATNTSSGLSYAGAVQYEVKVPDTTPPALVELSAPVNGEVYRTAQLVMLVANVSPDVTHVEFLDGPLQLGSRWSAPFEKMWQVDTFNNGVHTLIARGYDEAGNFTDSAPVTVTVAVGLPDLAHNVALATAGATATASSAYNDDYPASSVINDERAGRGWGSGSGGWNDANSDAWPDWVQVDLSGAHAIDRVVVYSVQDAYYDPVEPNDTLEFSYYGLSDFTVEGWSGTAWVTLATVTGNTLVKRTVSFPSFTTTGIRLSVTRGLSSYSRVTELEAWTSSTGTANLALASAGATASASSAYDDNYPASSVINNERAGRGWGAGTGGWNDASSDAWLDWVQVDLSGAHQIEHVVVYSVQDAYTNPIEPNDTLEFSYYGLRDFTVEGWSGSEWVTLATVTGNTLVKRTVSFPGYDTSQIRILVAHGLSSYARATEIEVWGR